MGARPAIVGRTRRPSYLGAPPERLANLLVSLVLAQCVYSPNSRWEPANEGQLQDQADGSGDRASNGEEGQPWEDQ